MTFETDKYEIDFLNVNNADAILIRCFYDDKQYIILIDAGNVSDSEKIINHLKNVYQNTNIDLAICTHPDKDHIGGFFGILEDEDITINEFWLIDPAKYLNVGDVKRYTNKNNERKAVRELFNKPGDSRLNLISILLKQEIDTKTVIQGVAHKLLPIKVVAPNKEYYSELVKQMVENIGVLAYEDSDTSTYDETALPSDEDSKSVLDIDDDTSPFNASSVVILFEPEEGEKFLFTGDANCASLKDMMETYNEEVSDITILKVPHHGSKHNMTTEIIEHLNPKFSIISAKGTRKHPNSGLVYWLIKYGNVYSTHKTYGYIHFRKNIASRKGNIKIQPLKKIKVNEQN